MLYTSTGCFTTEYAIFRIKNNKWFFDPELASELYHIFKNHSVMDWGCGVGEYVDFFISKGIDCKGYDGIKDINKITNGKINELELTNEINLSSDWILCLEVGEHIPKKYESTFINNLVNCCNKGIVISWAIPGQAGTGHLNNKANDEVISILSKKGLRYDNEATNNLRNHAKIDWFKNTIMVFAK